MDTSRYSPSLQNVDRTAETLQPNQIEIDMSKEYPISQSQQRTNANVPESNIQNNSGQIYLHPVLEFVHASALSKEEVKKLHEDCLPVK
jgi:hypothetical protein